MTENTMENRIKLSRDMVDAWDMDTLTEYAVGAIEENLANCDDEEFDGEWIQFYAPENGEQKD
jgi:hypothetical protein